MSTYDYELTERQLDIDTHRMALAEALNTALGALDRASRSVAVLRHKTVHDIEYVEGPDGDDVVSFIADSLRNTRAAYAIAHHINEHR